MKLPETWIEVRLGEIITDMQPGFAQRPGEEDTDAGTIPQIRTHNVTPEGRISLEGIKHVSPSPAEIERFSLRKGDIVFNNTNSEEWVGKTALFETDGEFVFSNHMTRLRVDESIANPEFIAFYLHFLWKIGYSRQKSKRWVSQAGIDQNILLGFKIILPILAEQDQVVKIFQHKEGLLAKIRQFKELFIETRKVLFIELFGNPESSKNKNWPIVRLGEHIEIQTGGTPSRENPTYFSGKNNWVKSTDLKDSEIHFTEEKITNEAMASSNCKIFPANTILLAMYGQGQTRGRTGKLIEPAACNQACAALLPSKCFEPDYIWFWLQLSYEYVRSLGRGGQQANLNLGIIRNMLIPFPSPDIQVQFSERLKALSNIFSTSENSAKKFAELSEAIQITAFTGELTEHWRNENIKTLRQEAEARRRRGFKSLSKPIIDTPAQTTEPNTRRESRAWLLDQLSPLQKRVLKKLPDWCVVPATVDRSVDEALSHFRPLPADDADALREFCEALADDGEEAATDHVRRVLDQLAALGFIAKVSILSEDAEGAVTLPAAYRPLFDDERSQLADVGRLMDLLRQGNEP